MSFVIEGESLMKTAQDNFGPFLRHSEIECQRTQIFRGVRLDILKSFLQVALFSRTLQIFIGQNLTRRMMLLV